MVAQDDFFSGMMDVIAPAPIQEDLTFLGAEMKKVCEKHGEESHQCRGWHSQSHR
jgi:hypothetical protein